MSIPVGPDAFTGTDATELHAYNAGWVALYADVAELQTNSAQLRGGGSEGLYTWQADSFAADQVVEAKLVSFNNYGGPCVRMTGSSSANANGYVALFDTGAIDLQKITNGVRSNLQPGIGTVALNDVIKIQVVGTTIKVFVNGIQVGTDQTDSSFATGQPGLYWLNAASARFDNWLADTVPSGASVSAPARIVFRNENYV